ncbi:MAG TPA: maleylpyruvate isomerase N-terminal domain-containing protein [Acidimicrobiales bacterium]
MSPAQVLSADEVATFLGAVDWFIAVTEQAAVAAGWAGPSALVGYSIGGLVAHGAVAGVLRLEQVLGEPEPTDGTEVDVAAYYGPNRVGGVDGADPLLAMARAAGEELAQRGHAGVLESCRQGRTRLGAVLPEARADRVVPVLRVRGGVTPLADYLRTRVLELLVHGDDVVASVPGLTVPDPPSAAVEVCLGLCLDLSRARLGDVATLRAFTRAERVDPGSLRAL